MPKNRVDQLAADIEHHKALYYLGKAEISDEQYDQLEQELQQLEPNHPILKSVGTSNISNKVPHAKKMLSLDKTYEKLTLYKWCSDLDVFATFKVDGSSCSLIYTNGVLTMAKTRGDGEFGENILNKALFVNSIPKKITQNGDVEIRGEMYCTSDNFLKLAHDMHERKLERPESQRNIVAGILGRKENIDLAKYLDFFAYDILSEIEEIKEVKTESEKSQLLQKMKFKQPNLQVVKSSAEVDHFLTSVENFMADGEYLIDGAVFSYNDLKLHQELGETSHHPRYKIAFKFVGETKIAPIISIDWQVSRNGVLTPVANIQPVEISGAKITRVTLHNMALVKECEIKIDDEIEIVRSGEVIPKFLRVVKASNNQVSIPKACPTCGKSLLLEDIKLRCINSECPSILFESMLYFLQTAGVEDVSDKRLEEMIKKNLIKNFSDILNLSVQDYLQLEKVKDKLALKMFNNIQKLKKLDGKTFITALGIAGLAKNKVEKLLENIAIHSMDEFLHLTEPQLIQIEGFAEKSSHDIITSIHEKKPFIQSLIKNGMVVEFANKVARVSSKLNNAKFCITGQLSRKREEIESDIKANGGTIVSSVSKNTDYLVTNETSSSSSKFVKATELKIIIISESELEKMLE
jgi:DNA ligase (NAD+)